ncbi:hypothetical protein K7X08_002461 [Anisodus acutangulus]|uniref:Chorismate mutase n=1 Tax=Anisodus acutangulus TaxID=402998 RepID=A0A9Q1LRK8_9SOLA|nr:hypothetical protein K7X08_002461 [Anisodus acutangulus]
MACGGDDNKLSLDSIRDSLIRQEDTIIFNIIERIKYPTNPTLYKQPCSVNIPDFSGSLFQYLFQETEALQSKVGRYLSPEENPFFSNNLPDSIIPPTKCTPVLHPAAESVNVNEKILDVYINQILPLFCKEADDGNFATTAACDIHLLQALSRRIHYGKFVAEVKFRDCTDEYKPLILAKDRDALMKLLTFEAVEEMVKKRVAKKAMAFGQEVTLNDSTAKEVKCKVDPTLVSRLYDEWVMPLTKLVEVEYLLRRLD